MSVTLELALDDARCLQEHLTRHIAEVDHELAHTDRRPLRHQLAADSERLRQIEARLAGLVRSAS